MTVDHGAGRPATFELDTTVPADLAVAVEAHGKSVAAGDNAAVLADFLPDRIGQLIASADVPPKLKGAEVRSITATCTGRWCAGTLTGTSDERLARGDGSRRGWFHRLLQERDQSTRLPRRTSHC